MRIITENPNEIIEPERRAADRRQAAERIASKAVVINFIMLLIGLLFGLYLK